MTRALYSCDPTHSRGRLFVQSSSAWRTEFQRDRDRIIHASAFRRLKHKTQVFVSPEGDHFRTRLTHSLEVAQIARSMARALGLNEDLTEGLALAHDLGHTAFGHAGEDALDAKMKNYGGFDHNAHALRIVTELEQRHIGFDGLNLTWETLEGLVKHNGPLHELSWGIAQYNARHDLWLDKHASLEAQVAAVADDIAYNAHDLDDGLRAGLLTLQETYAVPLIEKAAQDIFTQYGDVPIGRLVPEIVREIIGAMVFDILENTRGVLDMVKPRNADDVRNAGFQMVSFSATFAPQEQLLKTFLRREMYSHPKLQQRVTLAERVISDLFDLYFKAPQHLPLDWQSRAESGDEMARARCVADFIAGMTDRYAIKAYITHYGPLPYGSVSGDLLEDGLTI
jgi:dGTPase